MCFGLYVLLEEVDQYWMGFLFDPNRIRWRIAHLLLEVILAWGVSLFFLSLFRIIGNRETYYSKELTKSLLPVYLIHHPVAIYLGYIFSTIKIQREIAFFFFLLLVIAFSFYFYYFVKKFKYTSFLFGIQKDNKERVSISNTQNLRTKKI